MATGERRTVAPVVGPDDPRRFTDSGIEVAPLYTADDVGDVELGAPGEFPFTRGPYADMYRRRPWTMRQYAGYASATESNERYKYLLAHGSTGLSMAFDLPTQLGLDSDDGRCLGEVGRTGVSIDTIDDMRTVFDGIPLNAISTSMTINAPATVLLALYSLVGEEQGCPLAELRGTTQNDVLKEYIARGNFIYPPEGTMRLTTDLFAYCKESVPKWNTISISGYHFREKGCSAVQEVAFTLCSAIAYVQAALDTGLEVDEFAPRLAFFFNGHNNVVRVALQGFAAVCGGTQSLHTNGFDEALALPSERAAKIALRTQQIIAHESGATDTVDPFAGSYYVESLTDEIEESAWGYQERYRCKQDIVVGVNKYEEEAIEVEEILRVDPETEREQLDRLKAFKENRDHELVAKRLDELRDAARGTDNLMHPIRQALKDRCSMGEVCAAMKDVFGAYRPRA